MKIHFYTLFTITTVSLAISTLFFLASFFGFDFQINVSFLFLITFFLILVFLIRESFKNKSEIKQYFINLSRGEGAVKKSEIVLFRQGLLTFLRKILFSKYHFLVFFIFFLLIEVFIFSEVNNTIVLLLFLFLVFNVILLRIKSEFIAVVAIFFLFLSVLMLLKGEATFAEKITLWAYLFFLISVFRVFLQVVKGRKASL